MALNINFNFTALKLSIYDSRKPIFYKAVMLQLLNIMKHMVDRESVEV